MTLTRMERHRIDKWERDARATAAGWCDAKGLYAPRRVLQGATPQVKILPATPIEGNRLMPVTDNRNDPGLRNVGPDGMQETYLVLSDEERTNGFVRPVRRSYKHLVCGAVTTMGQAIAETYARDPKFYGGTYCVACRDHFPVGEHGQFAWDGTDEKVGT